MAKRNGFADVLRKQSGAWNKARKAADAGGSGFVEDKDIAADLQLEDGDATTYEAVLTKASTGLTKKSNQPYVSFSFVGQGGYAEGVRCSKLHVIAEKVTRNGPNKGNVTTVETVMERLAIDFQRLGYETVTASESDIEEICQDLTTNKPVVEIYVGYRNGYINVFINKLIAESGADPGSNVDDSEGYEARNNQLIGEQTENNGSHKKGDTVMWKSKGARKSRQYKIVRCNKSRKIVALQDADGTVTKDVPWGDLQPA